MYVTSYKTKNRKNRERAFDKRFHKDISHRDMEEHLESRYIKKLSDKNRRALERIFILGDW